MSGGGSSYTAGFRYLFGIHMGVCRGPVDEVVEVRVGDRTAWFGNVNQNQKVYVDAYNLFGGEDKEGGVQGDLLFMFGEANQLAPDELANMVSGGGGDSTNNPLPAIVFPSYVVRPSSNVSQSLSLNFLTDGQTQFVQDNFAVIDGTLNWFTSAPVLPAATADYEVKFNVLSSFGIANTFGSLLNTWLPMTSNREIGFFFSGYPSGNPWYIQLQITFRKGSTEGQKYEAWLMVEEQWTNPGGA